MKHKAGRYSVYIRPFSYFLDLALVNSLCYYVLPNHFVTLYFHLFATLSWLIISLNIGFYEVYRYTKAVSVFNKIFKQFALFTIVCFAFSGIYDSHIAYTTILRYTLLSIIFISLSKLFIFYFLRKYRVLFGGNFRSVIIVGHGKTVGLLSDFFNENPNYGYHLKQIFSLNQDKKKEISESFTFIEQNEIDEIYCSLNDLSQSQINQYIDYADNNLKKLKFISDEKDFFLANLKYDYYGYIPVASMRNIPLDDPINKTIKRLFDILFSIFVIVGILSWLTPILAILIKMESKGDVFFKQKRNGLNYHEFNCYKFRSMRPNAIADVKQVSKNDPRITKIGAFLRKTSLDELPQFFNVFFGDMSVVGPRPHMISETERFALNVDKFMVRHFIKPGITGMAQTHGFRGEVENEKDIVYRVKYDIYYVENWSLLLDIKIIFLTVINVFKGEEKAY